MINPEQLHALMLHPGVAADWCYDHDMLLAEAWLRSEGVLPPLVAASRLDEVDGYGRGNGSGHGAGSGSGSGYGYGAGNGSGHGYTHGAGHGDGEGAGYGAGSGHGEGFGRAIIYNAERSGIQ